MNKKKSFRDPFIKRESPLLVAYTLDEESLERCGGTKK